MDREKLLFYDIEVFAYDSLVVFMDITGEEVRHFWSMKGRREREEPSGFEGIPDLIEGRLLAGYNNYYYDDHILTGMMSETMSIPENLKGLNDSIIKGNGSGREVDSRIHSIDTMQQIDVSHPSLKQIEGNMGMSIVESSVPFDIDRPLTDEERRDVLEYCRNDVRATIEVYKLREKSYFDVKAGLAKMVGDDPCLQEKAKRWNTTTISAHILTRGGQASQWIDLRLPDDLNHNVRGIPPEVWDMWDSLTTDAKIASKQKNRTVKAYGCNFVFGLGGLHGAPSKPVRCGKVKHKDVASMYPSSIVALRALAGATDLYDQMRLERVAIKKTDPVRAGSLKIILNSVYGNFKNKYSTLLNPFASATVCIYGQIALFSLCRDLYEAGYEVINANTDGVVYKENPDLNDADERICEEWEKAFPAYKLDTDYYDLWIQRDVNNYIAVEPGGRITVKGGDVNKYDTNKFFSNNSVRIVQIAMVEYLVNKTPVLDTLQDNLDKPLLWQYVLKAGRTYKGVQNEIGEWQNNVNRIFACNERTPHTKLFKIRQDDGQVNFPDVPERMYIWNDDLDKFTDFSKIVDQEWYYNLINQKLKGWPKDVY